MSTTLHDEDRRAVDLFLDRNATSDHHTASFAVTPSRDAFQERIQSVERILHLLDQLPAADPPTNLADRTLKRLETALACDPRSGRAMTSTSLSGPQPAA